MRRNFFSAGAALRFFLFSASEGGEIGFSSVFVNFSVFFSIFLCVFLIFPGFLGFLCVFVLFELPNRVVFFVLDYEVTLFSAEQFYEFERQNLSSAVSALEFLFTRRERPIGVIPGATKKFCVLSQLSPLFRVNFRLK